MSNWNGCTCPDEEYILVVEPAQVVGVQGDPYEGSYVVDPKFESITLETKNKVLSNDVTVNPIEVARVSNPSGGKTVFIGGNFNG